MRVRVCVCVCVFACVCVFVFVCVLRSEHWSIFVGPDTDRDGSCSGLRVEGSVLRVEGSVLRVEVEG